MCKMRGMNTFPKYVADNGISNSQLAESLGVDHSTAWRLANGRMRPGLDLAAKIERITQGAVPIASWEGWKAA